ncbi:MAG: hypothetical protein ACYTHM_12385 [Planctomycetota bacterium]|jgi:hypothetical protein
MKSGIRQFRPLCIAFAAWIPLAGCTFVPVEKGSPPPDPFAGVVSLLKTNLAQGKTPQPSAVLAQLKRLAPEDPDEMLTALNETDVVLENFQNQLMEEDLRRMGISPGQFGRGSAFLQKVILDGGDGLFVLVYLHRLQAAGAFRTQAGTTVKEHRQGHMIAVKTQLIDAQFYLHREVFHVEAAVARLHSPDWRVSLLAADALLGEGFKGTRKLQNYALALLGRTAGTEERVGTLLEVLGAEDPPPDALGKKALDLGLRIGMGYLTWVRGEAEEDFWTPNLNALFHLVMDTTHPFESRLFALESALRVFGHGSELPQLTLASARPRPPSGSGKGTGGRKSPPRSAAIDNPRSYVKVMSPRLQKGFETWLCGKPDDAFLAALAVLRGADPFLKEQFSATRKALIGKALLGGLDNPSMKLRLWGIRHLEALSGCTFAAFDPFGEEAKRRTALKAMGERFSRTRFQGKGEELDRKRRLRTVRKALETVAILQRTRRREMGTYCGEVERLFGDPAATKAAGFERSPEGEWVLKFGFRFVLERTGDAFVARVRGPLWETDGETRFQIRHTPGLVEILPD